MLESLAVKNFQILTKLEVLFSPTITSIIGPTDSGKSSFIRVLRWLFLNTPRGKEFISWDQQTCLAKLVIDNNTIIRRISSTSNVYKLNDKLYKAFGSNIPEEIVSLLNVSNLNFQTQLDPIFWFMQTPGYIGRELNFIVNLEIIDESLHRVGQLLRSTNSHIEITSERINSSKRELDQLLWVTQLDMDLLVLEDLNERKLREASRMQSLESTLVSLRKAAKCLKTASKVLPFATNLLQSGKNLLDLQKRLSSLESILDQIKSNQDKIKCLFLTLSTNLKEIKEKFPLCPVCNRPLIEFKKSQG